MKDKIINVFVGILLTIILLSLYYINENNRTQDEETNTTVNTEEVVDQQLVIETLKSNYQIVGLEGDVNKTYSHTSNKWYGDKTITLDITGTFKMGYNLSDVTFTIKDNIITIKAPEVVLISFDLPYDEIEINKTVGLVRKDYSEEDIQLFYKEAKESAKAELFADEEVMNKAKLESQKAIKQLLLPIKNVKDVRFK